MSKNPTPGQKVWMIKTLAQCTKVLKENFDGEELEFLRYIFSEHPQVKQLIFQAQHNYSNRVDDDKEVK